LRQQARTDNLLVMKTWQRVAISIGGAVFLGLWACFILVWSRSNRINNRITAMSSDALREYVAEHPSGKTTHKVKRELDRRRAAPARAARQARSTAADDRFMQWALENTAVTDIAINDGISLFVTLTPDKYTNEANVQQIADTIARWYCLQTGRDFAVCRVYRGKRFYAKGDYRR
jgi:hypothetical protein